MALEIEKRLHIRNDQWKEFKTKKQALEFLKAINQY